ncbi:MAG: endo alpha-1,4 polygalactosaminidase [Gaiellales bacterium]
MRQALAVLAVATAACGVVAVIATGASAPDAPPVNAQFDYQIGGDYRPRAGVSVVSRDWFSGTALARGYTICYVNAFQTQSDEAGVVRPDEKSAWPRNLVLTRLGDDPSWGGEYLVDISTAAKREQAARWLAPMIRTCSRKGFAAVELDNLDSWTRFDGTPLAGQVPFGRAAAVAYAALLVRLAHANGLAAGQKNTVELPRSVARGRIGFDFAIAEECGRWNECQGYRDVYGDHVLVIEYRERDFATTCKRFGSRLSVVLRDVLVTRPGSKTYRYRAC